MLRPVAVAWALMESQRMHRVYCALRLNLPRRTTRRVPRRIRQPLAAPPVLNRTWALDFMTETRYDARRVRLLNGDRRGESGRPGDCDGPLGAQPARDT